MIKNIQVWGHSLSIKRVSILLIAFILLFSLLTIAFLSSQPITSGATDSVYVGVSFCGNTTQEAQLLIDKVKTYTNLFVLQSGPISTNETATTEICDYAASQGLNLIVYFGWFDPDYSWRYFWVENAPERYGDKFLGVYYYDEPGGIQIDYDWENHFINLSNRLKAFGANITWYQQYFLDQINGYLNGSIVNYDVEAQTYINYLQNDHDLLLLKNSSTPTFVSDYALYWWDYLGGYDVVLTQLGNNASIIQEIDLTKGAAHMQGKDWGTIVTWKYDEAPYLDSGEEIYNQMVLSYQAGAKYIIIFDYPTIDSNPYGVLTEDHFEAMQNFWQDITSKSVEKVEAEAVLVLPKNYGWGMRNVADRIWLWGPDEYSQQIWDISRTLIEQYGIKLDIVYDDPQFPVDGKYQQIYYWNQTLP